jgi:hypothetical protein
MVFVLRALFTLIFCNFFHASDEATTIIEHLILAWVFMKEGLLRFVDYFNNIRFDRL